MAEAFAERVGAGTPQQQATKAFQLAYQREPDPEEIQQLAKAIQASGLRAICRAILNSSELIYLD